eukprot:TRINITY_DN8558_c0_g1_i1.p1 TRINITY_DN8558_c0_g1~~TRINITY_DN8558_c0_g1_i1.p1  ORF type:complete len:400 (-),score=87.66 TRINITY_DN8558_c0_g1_i1:42-1241(-)
MAKMTLAKVVVFLSFVALTASLPYSKKSGVISLTPENFLDTVLGTSKITLVEFYAPWCGHCKSLSPHWIKAAEKLKGLVQVAAINCDEEQNKPLAGKFGIQGFPTIKLFKAELEKDPDNSNRLTKVPVDYNGPRTAAAIVKFALSHLTTKYIQKIKDDASEFLDDEEIAHVILFGSKPKTTNFYKALSAEYGLRLAFGEVAPKYTKLEEQFGVESRPTLVVVPKGGGDHVMYDGKLEYTAIATFLEQYANPPVKFGKDPSAGKAPEPVEREEIKLERVQSQDELEQHCYEKRGLCVIAFLPAEDHEDHESYLKVLEELVEQKKGSAFRFVWIDGEENANFRDVFTASTDLPALVALSSRKKRFGNFLGSFTADNISSFLDRILRGSRTVGLSELPSLKA